MSLLKTADQSFCSIESIEASESLVGTAPRADVWFLLEYPGRWGNKALKESSIPEAVKAHLNTQLQGIAEARLLLIKQSQTQQEGITFIAALPKAEPPSLYRFNLMTYEELLDLDLGAIVAQDARYVSALTIEPLFVTCTNGLRDRCCVLHGLATYWALAEKFPGLIWESTHHGGHRFAANFLHLPYGLSYGRLRPETAAEVLQAGREGHIVLDHFRGRTIYDGPVQAAEILLRRETGDLSVNGLRLLETAELAADQWRVRFAGGEAMHEVVIRREETGAKVHLSCEDEELSTVVNYQLEKVS
ncbi:MAG: sucrase ferredoxin [Anaerolineales bacterium]